KSVYALLKEKGLCQYYNIDSTKSKSRLIAESAQYEFLDDPVLLNRLFDYRSENRSTILLKIPSIHCSSCIWLLEKLGKLQEGIIESRVDFLKQTLFLAINEKISSLRKVVELLAAIGYPPAFSLESAQKKIVKQPNSLLLKLGVAAFCSANIMMFSFPEYLAGTEEVTPLLRTVFGYLSILLAIPTLVYSAAEYYQKSWLGLKVKKLTLEFPLALGFSAIFFRSVYEIMSGTGAGYLDSLTGLIFFLLIGKWFQNRLFETVSFGNSLEAYFPLAARILQNGKETTVPIQNLQPGDKIIIKNHELIPADSILVEGNAWIDMAFVTGESLPEQKKIGDSVKAGGIQTGETIILEVQKSVSDSYLTQLWKQDSFRKDKSWDQHQFSDKVGKWFTLATIVTAAVSFLFWQWHQPDRAMFIAISVLIVACPCALALAKPFVHGWIQRLLAKHGIYLQDSGLLDPLSRINRIVFDKTGTLTESDIRVTFHPIQSCEPTYDTLVAIHSMVRHSNHPLSKAITQQLAALEFLPVTDWKEIQGQGLTGKIDEQTVRIGSESMILGKQSSSGEIRVYVEINREVKGYYQLEMPYRVGLDKLIQTLQTDYQLALVSGDSPKPEIKSFFPSNAIVAFQQSPFDKLNLIAQLQGQGEKVLMVGDGINDAGAFKQSDIAVAVREEENAFTPAADIILSAQSFQKLPSVLKIAASGEKVIAASFFLSLLYNAVGLSFAVTGNLAPWVAAVIMPLNSITTITFCWLNLKYLAHKGGF
ncbi:MAG: heavy metal translocating P-type ATPase, partial [Bacteroidia bacterium]|nr:heavy metal translocating P-type ATPase [Bacteroidia bacterium]